jgi:hypothetical protein
MEKNYAPWRKMIDHWLKASLPDPPHFIIHTILLFDAIQCEQLKKRR